MQSLHLPSFLTLGALRTMQSISFDNQADLAAKCDFAALQEVEHLDLSYCQLKSLPSGIENLKSLKTLVLRGNPQLVWSKTLMQLSSLPNLQKLDISHNRLRHIPAEIYHFAHLQELVLDENPLSALSTQNLMQLPDSLCKLSVQDCTVDEISCHVRKLPALKEVRLSHERYDDLVRINLYNPNVRLLVA